MVGIVVVSHSKQLAQGVIELVKEMADEHLEIVEASGLEDGGIGTDAIKIMSIIEKIEKGNGIIILADVGSSILSAQTAIDLLEDENMRKRVRIADAPLVEGALIAAIQAGIGNTIEEVLMATEETKTMKKL